MRAVRISARAAALMLVIGTCLAMSGTAQAGGGGRFTFLDNGSYSGVTFPGAGYGEIPFEIDTDGDGKQELAVYYGGRMTIRHDNGSLLWGFNFQGGGMGEVPLATCRNPDPAKPGLRYCKQKFTVYYQGRFTFLHDDGTTYDGVTFPGADRRDIPLMVDTDGSGYQRPAVYRNGRFTFLNPDGTEWGVTFADANASDIPFAIDTDGKNGQELAVYRNGRVTVRSDNGTYWGFNFQGAGLDEIPLAIDTNGDGRQEFTMYNHKSRQLAAKQILDNPRIDTADHGNGAGRLVLGDLQLTADGGNGTAGTPLSTTMLELIDYLAQTHTLEINALESGGTGHSIGSNHFSGTAVDFGKLDGNGLTGRDPYSDTIIDTLKNVLPKSTSTAFSGWTGFGQSTCSGNKPTMPSGIHEFTDSCNHLHMQVPSGTS
jgi:hypothetical protein